MATPQTQTSWPRAIAVVINNAGFAADTPFPMMTRDQWTRVTRVTLDGIGSDGQDIVHDSLETPLNYLGMVVRIGASRR